MGHWRHLGGPSSTGGTSSAVVGKSLIFSGAIDDDLVAFLWENLLEKGAELWTDDGSSSSVKKDRRLILNSDGGGLENAFSVIDLFEHVRDLTTVATGSCMSAAVPIVAAGTPGFRFATKRTRFMVHSPKWEIDAQTRRWSEIQSKELKLVEGMYADVLDKYTKKHRSFWLAKQRLDEGYFFDAEEAKALGIIDSIIKTPF